MGRALTLCHCPEHAPFNAAWSAPNSLMWFLHLRLIEPGEEPMIRSTHSPFSVWLRFPRPAPPPHRHCWFCWLWLVALYPLPGPIILPARPYPLARICSFRLNLSIRRSGILRDRPCVAAACIRPLPSLSVWWGSVRLLKARACAPLNQGSMELPASPMT